MKDINDVFSEVIDKYIDFNMTKEEFDIAWEKVTKEMSRRYKKRGKELCSSKKEIDYCMKWFDIGKTKREVELEKEVEKLKSKLEEYEVETIRLNTKVSNLEYKLLSKKNTESEKIELEKKVNRIERKLKEYENKEIEKEIEACAKANRKFREYEAYANSPKGISDWADHVREVVRCEAEERREMEKVERLF